MIYHGKTLTSKVPLRDVCQAIAKYAFVTSPYPLLISAEVHCGVAQQEMIVDIMTATFGSSLIQAPVEGRPEVTVLPSPEELKHKILLKVRFRPTRSPTPADMNALGQKPLCRREADSRPRQTGRREGGDY